MSHFSTARRPVSNTLPQVEALEERRAPAGAALFSAFSPLTETAGEALAASTMDSFTSDALLAGVAVQADLSVVEAGLDAAISLDPGLEAAADLSVDLASGAAMLDVSTELAPTAGHTPTAVLDIGLGLDSAVQVGPVQVEADTELGVNAWVGSGEEGSGIDIGIDTGAGIEVGVNGPLGGGVTGDGPTVSGPEIPITSAPPATGDGFASSATAPPDAAEITAPFFPFLGALADTPAEALNSGAEANVDQEAFLREVTPGDAEPALVDAAVIGAAGAVALDGQVPAVGNLEPVLEIFRLEGLRLPPDFGAPGPEQAGLVEEAAPFGLDALGEALEDFLAQLEAGAATLLSWLAQLGPVPWILMSLALLAALHQYLRTRRHKLDRTFLSAWLM